MKQTNNFSKLKKNGTKEKLNNKKLDTNNQ